MYIRTYTDIVIDNNQFSIVEKPNKPFENGSALATLKKIEEVMCMGLKYSDAKEDEYSQLSQKDLWELLREKVKLIRDGHDQKASQVSSVKRFFGRVDRKEKDIASACKRIDRPRVFELPDDLIRYALNFSSSADMGRVAQLNKHGSHHAQQVQIDRAKPGVQFMRRADLPVHRARRGRQAEAPARLSSQLVRLLPRLQASCGAALCLRLGKHFNRDQQDARLLTQRLEPALSGGLARCASTETRTRRIKP